MHYVAAQAKNLVWYSMVGVRCDIVRYDVTWQYTRPSVIVAVWVAAISHGSMLGHQLWQDAYGRCMCLYATAWPFVCVYAMYLS